MILAINGAGAGAECGGGAAMVGSQRVKAMGKRLEDNTDGKKLRTVMVEKSKEKM